MTEKEYREVAACYKDDPALYERWLKAEAAYKKKFGYYSFGNDGFGLVCDSDDLEQAVRDGEPCCCLAEEKEIRAYFKRQGKKLPEDYARAFTEPDTTID